MKRIILTIVTIIFALNLSANPIDKNTALTIAKNYYSVQLNKSTNNLQLVYECISQERNINKKQQAEKLVYYYVFNSDNGFIIISGDDAVYPVLGYSNTGIFDADYLPDNFRKWLENYKKQIIYVVSNDIKATKRISDEWNKILQKQKLNKNSKAVSPLVSVKWGQSPYVNDMCPYDVNAGSGNGYHAVSGCPATAMAQIMKYWNYPVQGTGFHEYSHDTYGNLSANFGSTTYDWASMPNYVNSTNNAVATLMYHCGVAVEMQYGPHSSGSYVIMDGYPDEQTCEYAYKTYFGYDASTLRGLWRENYTDNDWIQLLKDDLDAGRPIQYAGFGQGGHTFVFDGYDNNNYFHVNWGWAGALDGYFLIDALNPGSGGTGSGAGTYNDNQQAVVGIQPPSGSTDYDLRLYDNLTVSPTSITYVQGFTVHTDVANFGTGSFNGEFTAAIFDENLNFVDFIEIKTGISMPSNSHYEGGLNFTTTGMLAVLPGTYYISMFYKQTGGNWKSINDGSYTNSVQLEVTNSNDIELYSDIVVSTGDITQNQSFNITLNLENTGGAEFNGDFSVDLHKISDGSGILVIDEKTGMTISAGNNTGELVFSSTGIDVDPGTYLLVAWYLEDGQDWELVGATNYTNPIKVIVKVAALQADIYEDNDSEGNAHNLAVSFSGNTAQINTNGSNNHNGDDLDYYKIELPEGYDYTITARAHDSYNSGNGQTYTNDVSWMYLYDGTWSDVYDDVMPNNFEILNGGTVLFNVAPYFVGNSGTYLLDISISRTVVNIDEQNNNFSVEIFPNPASDFIRIKTNSLNSFQKVQIFDVYGKLITTNIFENNKSEVQISTNNLSNGTYFLLITGENYVERKKIIISK